MADGNAPSWRITGDYFENCNCDAACPCIFSGTEPFAATPTQGACEVAFAFHLDQGTYGDVSLADLNVAMIARTPGPMIEGNWSAALYVDERADQRQQEALQAIFTGAAGVVMAVGEDGSTWTDYGMRWDNSGKNGHYAPIAWSNA